MRKAQGRTNGLRRAILEAADGFAGGSAPNRLPYWNAKFDDALASAMPDLSRRLGGHLHAFLDAMQDAAAAELSLAVTSEGDRVRIESRLFLMPVSGPAAAVRDMLAGPGLRELTDALPGFGFAHEDAITAVTTLALPPAVMSSVGPGRLRRALRAAAGEIVPGLQGDEDRTPSELLGVVDDPSDALPGEGRVMRVIVGVRIVSAPVRDPFPVDYLSTNGFADGDGIPTGTGREDAWLAWAEGTHAATGVSFGGPQSWFEASDVASVDAVVRALHQVADDEAIGHDDASALVAALTAPLPPAVPPKVPRTVRTFQPFAPVH